jgi:hypothetical protein
MVLMSLGSSILATLAVPTLLHRYPPRTSRLG